MLFDLPVAKTHGNNITSGNWYTFYAKKNVVLPLEMCKFSSFLLYPSNIINSKFTKKKKKINRVC